MKSIVIVGDKRVGKTETLRFIEEEFGHQSHSESRILHDLTERLLPIFTGDSIPEDHEKDTLLLKNGMTYRDTLIKVAEDALVPTFGRFVYLNSMNVEKEGYVYEIFHQDTLDEIVRLIDPIIIRIRLKGKEDVRQYRAGSIHSYLNEMEKGIDAYRSDFTRFARDLLQE